MQLLRVGSVTENAADLCVRVVRERGEIHIWPVLQFKLVVQRLCAAQLLDSKIEQLAAERCDGPCFGRMAGARRAGEHGIQPYVPRGAGAV